MSTNEPSKKIDSNIIIALISAFVTIILALIPFVGPKLFADKPTPTPTVAPSTATSAPATEDNTATLPPTVQPTDTALVIPDTVTPASTDTPLPLPTVIPIGNDWAKDCISLVWIPEPKDGQPQPVQGNDGCWAQPVYSFETVNGGLQFQDDGNYSTPAAYGLFAALPGSKGTVTVTVRLKELSKADILIGVYADANLKSDGYLMTIPGGDVKKQKIIKKLSYDYYNTEKGTQPVDQRNGYTITFEYSPGSVSATVPGVLSFPAATIQGSPKYIFLGYRTFNPGYSADGTFSTLKVDQ